MKKNISLLVFFLLTVVMVNAAPSAIVEFSSVAPSGHVLYYRIVGEGEVHVCFHNQYPELLGGFIDVPRAVKYNNVNYIVTGVADESFANCIRVQGISLPTTVYTVGSRAFYHCTDLRVVHLPKSLTEIGAHAFDGCTALVDMVLPNSVTLLGEYAFNDCVAIRHFVLSHGLKEIQPATFRNCKALTDILIPEQVSAIACDAFEGYEKLSVVILLNVNPPVPGCERPFGTEVHIRVPSKAFDAYKASTDWGQYTLLSL